MKIFFIFLILFTFNQIHARSIDIDQISTNLDMHVLLAESILNKEALEVHNTNEAYPAGHFYFLIGNYSESGGEGEYTDFYSISRWLSQRGFKVIINPIAYWLDFLDAKKDPKASVLLWSSHGFSNGKIADAAKVMFPQNAFVGAPFKLIIMSACNGEKIFDYYKFKAGTLVRHWIGTTYSSELHRYLYSTNFDFDLEKILGKKLSIKVPLKDY